MELIADSDEALQISEIADSLNLPRSTVLRILYTLQAEGFLRKEGKTYTLGGSLVYLGHKASQKMSITEASKKILEQLTDLTGETTQLATLNINKSMIFEVMDSPHPLAAHSRPGTLADIHCSASGKVLLAFGDPEKVNPTIKSLKFNKRTENTITQLSKLQEELSSTKSRGYGIDEEEYHEGIRCIAAPVFDSSGFGTFAIGLTASTSRFTREKINTFSEYVINAASQLTKAIGGHRAI